VTQKVPLAVQVPQEWLAKGILVLPPRFRNSLTQTNTTHVTYDDVDELLAYDAGSGTIEGVQGFYKAKGVKAGDKIHVQLRAIDPNYLRLTRSW
jgi:hypothetical protein